MIVLIVSLAAILAITALGFWYLLSWPKVGRTYPISTRIRVAWLFSSGWEKHVEQTNRDAFRRYRRTATMAYLGMAIVLGGLWFYAETLGREAEDLERGFDNKYGTSGGGP